MKWQVLGLPLLGTQEGQRIKEGQSREGLPLRRSPASALGSLPSVALSSGRAVDRVARNA
jgi:hypothetical protein